MLLSHPLAEAPEESSIFSGYQPFQVPHCHLSPVSVTLEMVPPEPWRKDGRSHAFCVWRVHALCACFLIWVNPWVCEAQGRENSFSGSLGSSQGRRGRNNSAVTPLPPRELAGESANAGTSDTTRCWLSWTTCGGDKHTAQILSPISLSRQQISS